MAFRTSKLWLLRVVLVGSVSSLFAFATPFSWTWLTSALIGLGIGLLTLVVEQQVRRCSLQALVGALTGLIVGALLALIVVAIDRLSVRTISGSLLLLNTVLLLTLCFIGYSAGLQNSKFLNLKVIPLLAEQAAHRSTIKILDTSVLIDGRICEIVETGFLEGPLAVPQFVLHELQLIADSSDNSRRNRGRRGLDVVSRLQQIAAAECHIINKDFPLTRTVDLKLIELAKHESGTILTNDLNLNKLSQVQGIQVLNINDLANALRPVVLPGELMRVSILKEGKEYNQGVAYLDDGTMVVVDNARRYVSRSIDITVTSVLQTTAGKMIFGRYDDRANGNGEGRSSVAAT